jgi:hypothetical protein
MSARISDISLGGCYVDTFCPFPRKSNVKIGILRDGEFLEASTTVVYSKIGMGLSLLRSLRNSQNIRDQWIAELSSEAPLAFVEQSRQEPVARGPT